MADEPIDNSCHAMANKLVELWGKAGLPMEEATSEDSAGCDSWVSAAQRTCVVRATDLHGAKDCFTGETKELFERAIRDYEALQRVEGEDAGTDALERYAKQQEEAKRKQAEAEKEAEEAEGDAD